MLALDAGIEHRDDARMLQAGELARFLDEHRLTFGGARPADMRDLDRHRPFELAVESFVHRGEAATPDGPANDVAAEAARSRTPR